MISSARKARALSFLACTALFTSCANEPVDEPVRGNSPAEVQQYQPPAQVLNATVVWSAEPGINLFDERGRLIRAAEEASLVAHYGGLEQTYPGFMDVLDHDYARRISPRTDRSLAGTRRAHILAVADIDTGFKATVCTQPSLFAVRWNDGDYRISNYSGGESFVQFDHTTERNKVLSEALPPDIVDGSTHHGTPLTSEVPVGPHWQAPPDDLFTDAGWTITFGADLGGAMHRCEEWGRSIHPDVPADGSVTIRTDTPPQTLPAYPGW